MRKSTRLRLFFAGLVVSTALGAFIVACGDDDGGGETPTTPDSGGGKDTGTQDTGAKDTGSGDASTDAPKDTGSQFNPGDATVLDGGPDYEGGIACVVGGQVEEEPNDEPDAANQLRVDADAGCVGTGCSRCGVIFDTDLDAGADSGDGGLGGTELEYVTFSLQATTKSFYIQFGGDVTLTVSVEDDPMNKTYVINASSSPALPFTLGKRYFIQVKSNTGAKTPWRVTLFETQ